MFLGSDFVQRFFDAFIILGCFSVLFQGPDVIVCGCFSYSMVFLCSFYECFDVFVTQGCIFVLVFEPDVLYMDVVFVVQACFFCSCPRI